MHAHRATLALVAFICGALLAWAESWNVVVGFYYVISNLTGLANPLTNQSPESSLGKVVDVTVCAHACAQTRLLARRHTQVALISISVSATIIGLIGYLAVLRVPMRTRTTHAARTHIG